MSDSRWTVDEDGWLTFDRNLVMISSWNLDEYHDAQGCIRPDAFDALVAAVRDAARVPERLRGYLNDPDTLADDIDSQIHQHCGSDNSCSDEHNDWVHDLTGQIMNLLGFPS